MPWRESLSHVLPSFEQITASIALYLPRVLGAISVLLLGWLLAVVVRAALRRLSGRLVARLPEGRARAALSEAVDGEAGEALAVGGFWLILFTAFLVAAETLGLPALSAWIAGFGSYVPRLIVAGLIVFAGVVIGRIAGAALAKVAAPLGGRSALRLGRALQVVVVVIGVLVASHHVDINVSLITTIAAVVFGAAMFGASLAFALGARGTVSNILAMHYFAKRHALGDVIRLAEHEGTVIALTTTSVILEAEVGEVEIPGHHFTSEPCARRTTAVSNGN